MNNPYTPNSECDQNNVYHIDLDEEKMSEDNVTEDIKNVSFVNSFLKNLDNDDKDISNINLDCTHDELAVNQTKSFIQTIASFIDTPNNKPIITGVDDFNKNNKFDDIKLIRITEEE